MIADRHIRYDWKEFNDRQDQRTVSALCGVRTKPYLAGIPGVTDQEPVVYDRSRRLVSGWCINCCVAATAVDLTNAPWEVRSMHKQFFEVIAPIVKARRERLAGLRN